MKAKTLLEFIKKDFKDFEQYVYFTKEMVDTALEDIDSLEHQSTISQLQARIEELEEPRTCDGCYYLTVDEYEDGEDYVCIKNGKCSRKFTDYYKTEQNQ